MEKKIILLMLMALFSMFANAQQISYIKADGAWYQVYDEAGKKVTTLSKNSIGEVVGWGSEFFGCENLTSIVLPNSITEVGEYAFYGCKKLTSIIIPNSVMEIGQAAFECCKSLKTITLPGSLKKIGISQFFYCYALETIFVPNESVEFFKKELIEKEAFLHEPHPQILPLKE